MTETADDSSGKMSEKDSITDKSAIDEEKYDTNWCDMPPEIKLKCIGKMDFLVRYQLRLTARTENQLVDSLKYKFGHIELEPNGFSFYKEPASEGYSVREFVYSKTCSIISCFGPVNDCGEVPDMKTVDILPYVLKHCDFKTINFSSVKHLERIDFGKLGTVLKPKLLALSDDWNECETSNTIIQILKICWDQVEKIKMHVSSHDIPFEQLFAIPSVFNAADLNIYHKSLHCQSTNLIPLIEKWIEIDARVGTKLSLVGGMSQLSLLFDHFQSRSVSREEPTMRIKTDNPDKHIWMQFWNGFNHWQHHDFSVVVIPSDIDESRYSEFVNVYPDSD